MKQGGIQISKITEINRHLADMGLVKAELEKYDPELVRIVKINHVLVGENVKRRANIMALKRWLDIDIDATTEDFLKDVKSIYGGALIPTKAGLKEVKEMVEKVTEGPDIKPTAELSYLDIKINGLLDGIIDSHIDTRENARKLLKLMYSELDREWSIEAITNNGISMKDCRDELIHAGIIYTPKAGYYKLVSP